jgi:hypothetical protein
MPLACIISWMGRGNTMAATGPFEPVLTLWDAWQPADVARLLAGVRAPWYVAGGWAIDLFLGGQRREHGDLEIAVPRDRFAEIATALGEYELLVPVGGAGAGLVWPLEQAGELLDAHHQTWVREPGSGCWRLDIFREPSDGAAWVYRRDERIRLRYDQLIRYTPEGIPYGCPEVILLFKAKRPDEPKNQADFAAVIPRLSMDRCRWLGEALALAHPDHRGSLSFADDAGAHRYQSAAAGHWRPHQAGS